MAWALMTVEAWDEVFALVDGLGEVFELGAVLEEVGAR